MNRLADCFAAVAVLALFVPDAVAGNVTVDKNNVTNSYECDGNAAVINGNRNVLKLNNCTQITIAGNYNQITLTGNQTDLSVSGNHNQVVAGDVKNISTMGNNNGVTWTSPNDDDKPAISNLGNHNSISRAKP